MKRLFQVVDSTTKKKVKGSQRELKQDAKDIRNVLNKELEDKGKKGRFEIGITSEHRRANNV